MSCPLLDIVDETFAYRDKQSSRRPACLIERHVQEMQIIDVAPTNPSCRACLTAAYETLDLLYLLTIHLDSIFQMLLDASRARKLQVSLPKQDKSHSQCDCANSK